MPKELLCIGMWARVWKRERYHRLEKKWLFWRRITNRFACRLRNNDNNDIFFHDYEY